MTWAASYWVPLISALMICMHLNNRFRVSRRLYDKLNIRDKPLNRFLLIVLMALVMGVINFILGIAIYQLTGNETANTIVRGAMVGAFIGFIIKVD